MFFLLLLYPVFAFMLLIASIGMFSPGNINTIDYITENLGLVFQT